MLLNILQEITLIVLCVTEECIEQLMQSIALFYKEQVILRCNQRICQPKVTFTKDR